jgi:RNA polymerase sigma factor (sigma-70 family)
MTTLPHDSLLRDLRRAALLDGDGVSDAQLLERFLARRDEAAFEALVRRHGAMVLGVCRRVLKNSHDAEDAFQATFLVLVRRAASLSRRELLGNWLYGVAYRTSLEAHAAVARRRRKERQVSETSPRQTVEAEVWSDVQPLLDRELSRLPDKYRVPVVLCDLEGKTRREAARQLGLPEGTLSGRLTTARRLLAVRLTRHGLALSGGALATALARNTASVGVPGPLVAATVKSATLVASGQATTAVVSARVAALTDGVMKALLLTRLKMATAVLVLSTLVVGTGLLAHQALGARQPESPAPEAAPGAAHGNSPVRFDRSDDPLPAGALVRLGTTRFRCRGAVGCLAFSPDSKLLAGGSRTGNLLLLWDAATGKEMRRFEGHQGWVWGVAFSPDGKTLASCSADGSVRLWEVATGKEQHRFIGHDSQVFWVAFSPDGKVLTSCSQDQTVRLWEAATGKELHRLEGHQDKVPGVAFSPDGKTVASASGDRTIRLWDCARGTQLRTFTGHEAGIDFVAFSPDGKTLASGSDDRTVRLWTVATGKELRKLEGHKDQVRHVAFSPDGALVASASHDGTVGLWEAATGKRLHSLPASFDKIRCVAFSPDGNTIASGGIGWDFAVRLWDPRTGKERTPVGGHQSWVGTLALVGDDRVLTASQDGTLREWELATGKPLRQFEGHQNRGKSVAVSVDGRQLATGGREGTIRLWDPSSARVLRQLPGHKDQVTVATFSRDGKVLATAGVDCMIRLWDPATGNNLGELGGHSEPIYGLALSPNGKVVASSSQDGTVRLWDVAAREERRQWGGQEAPEPLAFSPDGKYLAVGTHGKTVFLWDVATGREVRRFEADAGSMGVAFSPDGKTLATGTGPLVLLWEVATGKERLRLKGHREPVVSVLFSRNGRLLISGSGDTSALVWDVTGRLREGRLAAVDLAAEELNAAWSALADVDAAEAYRALWTLTAAPQQAVPLLEKQLRPAPAEDGKRLGRLIDDLDHDDFAVREKAEAELGKRGATAEAALRKALEGTPSAEQATRIRKLLDNLQGPVASPDVLRSLRALEVLEQIGTSEARKVLEALAKGEPDNRLTQEAKAVLERLALPPTSR